MLAGKGKDTGTKMKHYYFNKAHYSKAFLF